MWKKHKLTEKIPFIISVIVLLWSRFYRLGLDIVHNDAYYFKDHSYEIMQSIKAGAPNFFVTIQPGILTVYSCIIGYKSLFYLIDFKIIDLSGKSLELALDVLQKIPQVSLNVVLTVFLAWFLSYKVFKFQGVLYSVIFVLIFALEPDFILQSRVIQNDIIQALLLLSSACTFYYGLKFDKHKWIWVSGFFGGLAFIQKSSSLVILLFVFVYSLVIFLNKLRDSNDKYLLKTFIKIPLIYFLAFCVSSFIFFPAFWFDPFGTIYKMVTSLFLKSNGIEVDFNNVSTPHIQESFYYFKYFLSKYSLIYLLGLFIAIRKLFMNKNIGKFIKNKEIIWYLIVFSAYYLFLLQISDKKVFRYLLVFTIALVPVVSWGYYLFLKQFKLKNAYVLIFVYLFFSSLNYYYYFPDFGLYKNIIASSIGYKLPLDGYKGFVEGGTGMYKLGQFLNDKYPNKSFSLPRSKGLFLYYSGNVNELNFSKVQNSNDLVVLPSHDIKNNELILEKGYSPIDNYIVRDEFKFIIYQKFL